MDTSATDSPDDGLDGPDPSLAADRQAFLEAGTEILFRTSHDPAAGVPSLLAVCRETGLSSGAFYRCWPTQSAFLRDLVHHALAPIEVVGGDPVTAAFAALGKGELSAELVGSLADWSVTSAVESPAVRAQLLLWSLTDDPEVIDALGEVHRAYQTTFAEFYRRLFEGTNARLVDGITYEHLAVMLTALLDGLTIRRRIDPEAADVHVVSSMALALLCGLFMTPVDSEEDPNPGFRSWTNLSNRFTDLLGG
jgi:AcrR family transcriptional regulator